MERPRTSTRDIDAICDALAMWLQPHLDMDEPAQLELLGRPADGNSSETILFDLIHGGDRTGYVLRLPPPADAFPLFPWYDLERQVRAMRLVRARTSVPVPAVPWFEPESSALGAPFFVMERVDGRPPPDVPPYVFEGWVIDATPAQRGRMQTQAVEILAGIHAVHASDDELAFLELNEPGDTPLRRHVAHQRRYYDWIRGDGTFAVIDGLFEWLEERWPEDEGEAVVSWGDARLANMLFRDTEVVAVLDWEAVALGPRELDLGWLLFFHEYFQRVAARHGYVGLPDWFRRADVVAAYAAAAGHEPRDLDWYLAYAALRQALTSIRVWTRAVHFGERERPEDPNDLIADRDHLERILLS